MLTLRYTRAAKYGNLNRCATYTLIIFLPGQVNLISIPCAYIPEHVRYLKSPGTQDLQI